MERVTRRAVLSLGSNLGDRFATLRAAVAALAATPGVDLVAVSPGYETVPVGGPPQPDYLNAVVLLDTALTARALLIRAQQVENAYGRQRGQRWGPRTLDVDVIALGDLILVEEDPPPLVLPHPRAHERAFVLAPWLQVDPAAVLPGRGCVAELLGRLRPAQLAGVRPGDVPLAEGE